MHDTVSAENALNLPKNLLAGWNAGTIIYWSTRMEGSCLSRATLDSIFPAGRTDAFFDALYGGAEEGAYDIRLVCKKVEGNRAELAFQLIRRPGKCLTCSLTYGLPEVFQRHPVINISQVAEEVGNALGWHGKPGFSLGKTMEINDDLQMIPFTIEKSD